MDHSDEAMSFEPTIDPAIWRLRPDFAALSIVALQARNGPSDADSAAMLAAAVADMDRAAPWAAGHLEAWRAAYRAFGAKPQRTPCSAEALRKRAGSLPAVNRLVDVYNALSIRYAVPIGGEDADAYVGHPRLTVAPGGEPFATMRDGVPASEPVEAGEVIWRDEAGVTCRRWNWRQSVRTRLEPDSTAMWFVLERLEPMPLAALEEAGSALVAAVRALSPAAVVRTQLLCGPAGE